MSGGGAGSATTPDPKAIVAAGYDRIADRYLAWSALRPSPARLHALELGCGAGVPMTAALANGRRLTGVDISAEQIRRARRNVPGATFIQADMTTLEREPASLDAVVAFYSLTHVPRDQHAELFGRIRTWLRPGGLFLASLGVEDDPGTVEPGWLGVEMYFSQFSARVGRRLVAAAGLVVERAEILTEPEDRFDARFLWVVARTPGPSGARSR